jgi:hypothetical protein
MMPALFIAAFLVLGAMIDEKMLALLGPPSRAEPSCH